MGMGRPLNLYPLLPEAAFGQVVRSFTPTCKILRYDAAACRIVYVHATQRGLLLHL